MNSNSQAAYSMIVLLVLGALVWFLTSQNLIPKEYRTSDAKVFTSLGGAIVAILAGIVAIVLFSLK
jgi:H+/Cl- antiporter ClcA